MSDLLRKQLQMLGIQLPPLGSIEIGDSETLYFTTQDRNPVALWSALREVVDQTGFWPFLTADETILENRLDWLPTTVQALLPAVTSIDARTWLDLHVADRVQWDVNFREEIAAGIPSFEPKPRHQYDLPYQYDLWTGLAGPLIVLIPTIHNWQIPLYLCFGGFNHCPSPEENACIWRYWNERYGTESMSMTRDGFEFVVHNPPQQPSDAYALACDQFGYCHDMHQRCGSVTNLASQLLGGTSWSFWWD